MAILTLGVTVYGRWRLAIDDSTVTGWLMTGAFIATVLLCCLYARCAESHRGHRVFWWSLAVGLLVLGINKQLDLHVLIEAVAIELAKRHGWYSQRRAIQMWFVTGLATISLALAVFTGWAMRGVWRQRWLPFCGIVIMLAFILARAASINHVCEILNLEPPAPWLLGVFQAAGIACIGVSALAGIINCRRQGKE